MLELSFEWDERKNRANVSKHGITFEEARAVFDDEQARIAADPEHSQEEERFVIVGSIPVGRLVTVVYCYREEGAVIRIISARPASRNERTQYEGYLA